MTDSLRLVGVPAADYWRVFGENLSNPRDIWKHAFEEQLSQQSRNLLLTLFALPQEIFLEDLERAFETFHKYHAGRYGYRTGSSDFEHALKELESSFIRSSKSIDRIVLKFVNPSVKDFLANYVAQHNCLGELIDSSVFHEQLVWLWEYYKINTKAIGRFLRPEDVAPRIAARMSITIFGPSCRLANYKDRGDKASHKRIWPVSFEEKAALSVDMLTMTSDRQTNGIFQQFVIGIQERIKSKQAQKEDLFLFLKKAKSAGLLESDVCEHLVRSAKEYLMTDKHWIDDFRVLTRFLELFPDLVTQDEREAIRSSFVEFVSDVYLDESDPDYMRAYVDELRSIGEFLVIDVSEQAEQLETRATEVEEENFERDMEYHDYSGSEQFEHCSDADIRSMFGTMRF